MSEIERLPHVPGLGPHTLALISALKDGKVGDILTDEKLSEVARGDVSPGGQRYGNLTTAMRHTARHHGVVWGRIKGAGAIKCLNSGEIVNVTRVGLSHIARVSRRNADRIKIALTNGLPDDQKIEAHAIAAQLGTIAVFAGGNTTKRLAVNNVQAPVTDTAKMLDLFK